MIMKKIYLSLGLACIFTTVQAQQLVLVKDIRNGAAASAPANLTGYGGKLYFSANDGINGVELWESDGSESGTKIVQDFVTGTGSFNPSNLKVYNNSLFFSARVPTTGVGIELYKYQPASGISLFADVYPGTTNSSPNLFVESSDNKLFFRATDPASSAVKLFVTDGIAAPVVANNQYSVSTMGRSGTEILAGASLDGIDNQLYSFNGTAFSLLKIIRTAGSGIFDTKFYKNELQGLTYFVARTDEAGYEPWVTDGTTEGTHLLKDINTTGENPGVSNSASGYFTEYKGKVFFAATSGDYGGELWLTDGTTAGTVLFKDIVEGNLGSNPANLTIHNGLLYFLANDPAAGRELWVSDGTAEGTHLVADFNPGSAGLSAGEIVSYNGVLYLNAVKSGATGAELYKFEETPVLAVSEGKSPTIKVYPNPSNGTFKINAEKSEAYRIYDYSGKMVKEGKIINSEIKSGLKKGNYILTIQGEHPQSISIIIK